MGDCVSVKITSKNPPAPQNWRRNIIIFFFLKANGTLVYGIDSEMCTSYSVQLNIFSQNYPYDQHQMRNCSEKPPSICSQWAASAGSHSAHRLTLWISQPGLLLRLMKLCSVSSRLSGFFCTNFMFVRFPHMLLFIAVLCLLIFSLL